MAQKALELIYQRNRFYQENCHRIMIVIGIQVILAITLLSFIYYQQSSLPKPIYFPTTADGRLIRLKPLSQAILSDEEVSDWVKKTANIITSFDFTNYRGELQTFRDYFTGKGHRRYLDALEKSNNLESVKQRKQVVQGVVTGDIEFLDKFKIAGRFAWKVRFPMNVYYRNSQDSDILQRVTVFATLVRVPQLSNPDGIAIHQFVY